MAKEHEFDGPWWQYPPLRNAIVAAVVALIAFALERLNLVDKNLIVYSYWFAIILGGYTWAWEGIEDLIQKGEISISMLMIGATTGASYLGMWDEAAALVVLYGIAEGIEEYTFNRTRNAIRSLLDLAPREARLLRDGKQKVVPAETLQIGDEFIVLPGEAIPSDGEIIEGKTTIDESPVTGESVPVEKQTGDKVFAATVNGQATLTIRATTAYADNTLSRIIDLIENAQDQKGHAQEWMERFGRRYSPTVLSIAALLVILPMLFQLDFDFWTEKAVVLLVAAAPCALIISLPIAMSAGISGAGKRGILIKGGAHLEHLGIIKTIAFDKTGTLTHGKPAVTDVKVYAGSEEEMISLAAGIEKFSAHPLALAIVRYAEEQKVTIAQASNTKALPGSGTQGDVDGQTWHLGSPTLFREFGLDLEELKDSIYELQNQGKTVVLFGNEKEILGLIAMQDVLRENASQVIQRLHEMDIRTVMLTGDNQHTAQRVAEQLGIDEVHANLKPDEKVVEIEKLMKAGPTLMVGDGINDAPALALATCGVAMGAAGTDAAIEAADIALMADDLGKLEEAMQIGQKARKVSLQNIVFSLIVLIILIPAGVGGFLPVAMVVMIHEASELLAVANGLRCGRLSS